MAGTIVRPSAAPAPSTDPSGPTAKAAVWRPSPRGIIARVLVLATAIGLVLLLPLVVPATDVNVVSRVTVFAMVALSLNVLVGYTGQVSLGHAAFLGFGAFGSGYALTELGLPWLVAAGVAVLIGAIVAVLLGGVALRIQGLYLALVTLAFGLFSEQVVFSIPAVTGGGGGGPAPPPPRPAFALDDVPYAYLCLAALALVWVIDRRVTASKAGRAIRALRDSERVAASWGINVTGYKLLAFVISGAVAGLAGALFASIEQIVSNLTFSFTLSLTFLFMAVIGGVGSRIGVVIGAALIGSMPFVLDRVSENNPGFPVDGSAATVVTALLLLLVLVRFPGGIAQLLGGVVRWCSFRPWKATNRAAAPTPTGGDRGRP